VDLRGVAIALDRPGVHDLAAGLPDGRQGTKFAVDLGARFLAEFPAGVSQEVDIGRDFALRDRPRAKVFLGPERAAGMDQEHLDAAPLAPIEQKAGADFGHGWTRARRQ
jgi:hypothetical protein